MSVNTINRRVKYLAYLLDRMSIFLSIVTFIGVAIVVVIQVVARFALTNTPVWTEEAARYLFVYLVALTSGLAIRRLQFVSLEIFQHRLSSRGKTIYRLLLALIIGVFCCLMLPYSMEFSAIGRFQTSPALGVQMHYVFSSTVVFFALVSLYSAIDSLESTLDLMGGNR